MPALWKFELSEYDANWPMLYRAAVAGLEGSLPIVIAFEHVGSTSIPGMASVATIDILAGVGDLAQVSDSIIDALTSAGWENRPDVEAMIPNRRFFNQPAGPPIELPGLINCISSVMDLRNGAIRFCSGIFCGAIAIWRGAIWK